jgi:hypothetical protein
LTFFFQAVTELYFGFFGVAMGLIAPPDFNGDPEIARAGVSRAVSILMQLCWLQMSQIRSADTLMSLGSGAF